MDRPKEFKTSWGAPLKPVYGPPDTPAEELGAPGEFPFTRGVHPEMHRKRLWTMRQYAGFGSAVETNKRYRFLLEQGQTGLSVAFDLPTQMGYDPDAPMARGEAGKVGVSIASLEDMQDLFEGIPLDRVSTSMTINATASILLSLYVATAQPPGRAADRLSGTVQNDILKEYIARGTYIFPPGPSMRLITDTFAYCKDRVPRWNTISISGYHMREAGSTAVQEVAFTLANGIAYVQAAVDAGLGVDVFAPQLSFFFNAHNDLLEEVAKFRAARRLWARIMRERFSARDPRSLALRFHAQTAGSMLTAQQPENNIVRVTIQALAAVLGGCQSLHTNSMDEALALPTESAVRIALRTQQILAHESGVADVADSLGGAFAVERLTADIEEAARTYIRQDRRPRRRRRGHPLHAARDPGRGLPLPARGRGARADRGRRQRVRDRRAAARRTSSRWMRPSATPSPSGWPARVRCAMATPPGAPSTCWKRRRAAATTSCRFSSRRSRSASRSARSVTVCAGCSASTGRR